MLNTTPQEAGRYRVLLIRVGKNTEEEKEAFCAGISKAYGVAIPLLKKIVDRSPIVLKKNLSLKKAEILADLIASHGAAVSIEKSWEGPAVSVEFEEKVSPCIALEMCALRKTAWGAWNVLGRAKNITRESLKDVWALVQLFGNADEFLAFEEVPILINPLPPGEGAPFKAVFEGGLEVKRVSLAFKDASGRHLPAKDLLTRQEWISVATWFPKERDNLEDSDLDVPVLEIHGKPDSRGAGGEESDEVHFFTVIDDLQLDIDPPIPHTDSPALEEMEEGAGEDELSTLVALDQELHRFLLSENTGPEQDEESAPGQTVGLTAQADFPEDVRDETPVKFREAETILLPSSVPVAPGPAVPGEPGTELKNSVAPAEEKAVEVISQPEEPRFQPDEVPLPLPEESGSAAVPLRADETAEPILLETFPFPWIDEFRRAVEGYYLQSQPVFPAWFFAQRERGMLKDPVHCILTILIHVRFEQMIPSEKALENTEKVYTLALKPDLILDEVPPLEGTQFFPGEEWRFLFYRAISRLRKIAGQVAEKRAWDALELEKLIQVIPHISPKGSRTAVRWLHELTGEIVQVDFGKTLPIVTENLYRVASRLGVVDPHFDHFRGPNSPGDLKIQSFARMALASHPAKIEEPMDRIGMEEEKGGRCFKENPNCEGCLFENCCQKLYIHFNPSEKGMLP